MSAVLACGCKSAQFHELCDMHKNEYIDDHRRLMGIAGLTFTHRDFTDLRSLVDTLQTIKLYLISNPKKPLLIKINPEPR